MNVSHHPAALILRALCALRAGQRRMPRTSANLAYAYNAARFRTDLEWFGTGEELRLIPAREAARLRSAPATTTTNQENHP